MGCALAWLLDLPTLLSALTFLTPTFDHFLFLHCLALLLSKSQGNIIAVKVGS